MRAKLRTWVRSCRLGREDREGIFDEVGDGRMTRRGRIEEWRFGRQWRGYGRGEVKVRAKEVSLPSSDILPNELWL